MKYSNQSDDFYERPAIGRFFFFPKGALSEFWDRAQLYTVPVKLRSCRRLDEIEAGVYAPARFHPKENCIFLALLCSCPFARYHKTRIEKADWKQKHFQSAYLFVRQISFQLMPGLPQLKGRCTLPPFHKAHHLPTLPMRV